MEQKKRIGILGGTFHPIHNGHLSMALLALNLLNLDEVRLMVDRIPPHKSLAQGATSQQRLEMARLACKQNERIIVDDMELRRSGVSYTADTLEQFSLLHPNDEIFFIIGTDMLETIEQWHDPKRIMRLATLVCVRRAGMVRSEDAIIEHLKKSYDAKIELLPCVENISSTMIRQRLLDALPVSHLLPNDVERYIYSEGLYLPEDYRAGVNKLRTFITQKRFDHTIGVVTTAIELADRFGVDGRKARTAALLHDCAKSVPLNELLVLTDGEPKYAPILHAQAGAIIAKSEFGETDEDVLQAIRLHTTGEANMTSLDKIIYLADMIEPSRDFEGVAELRKEKDLDNAILLALQRSICYIKSNGGVLHPASLRAYKFFGGTDG